jgi:hypothetical protein
LQIKRPEPSFDPASCPYCVQPNFGIIYEPFNSTAFRERQRINSGKNEDLNSYRRKSVSHQHPSVVTTGLLLFYIDDLYPDWRIRKQRADAQRAAEEQRAAVQLARRQQLEFLTYLSIKAQGTC